MLIICNKVTVATIINQPINTVGIASKCANILQLKQNTSGMGESVLFISVERLQRVRSREQTENRRSMCLSSYPAKGRTLKNYVLHRCRIGY